MRIVVVNTEKDLAELRARVVRPGTTEAGLRSAEASIRAANPHLDLARLQPGAVVVLPDHPDVAAEPSGRAAASLDAAAAAVPAVGDAVKQAAQAATRKSDELARVLADREVNQAATTDDELRAEIARLAAAVTEERRRAQEWARGIASSMAGWQAAAEELRRLT
jgi:hypothetical protein